MQSKSTWIFILFLGIPLCAQRMTFHAVTRLVQVPVEVFNSHGQFLPGLAQTDFQLRINGKLWPIANLDLIQPNAPAAPSNRTFTHQMRQWRGGIFSNHIQESPRNRIVFLFDMTHIPNMARAQIRQKVSRILRRPIPGNEDIAVLEENPGLIELQSFTQNRKLLRNAIHEIGYYPTRKTLAYIYRSLGGLYGGAAGGDAEPLQEPPSAPTPETYSDAGGGGMFMQLSQFMGQVVSDQQYYGTVDTLNMISRMLSNIPGHKEILWFTNDTNYTAPGNPDLELTGKRLRKLTRTLNNANISLFPIDPDGLATFAGDEGPGSVDAYNPSLSISHQGIDPAMLMTHNLASAGAATFATRTGGRAYSDFNSIAQILINAQRYWNTGYVRIFILHKPRIERRDISIYRLKFCAPGLISSIAGGFMCARSAIVPGSLTPRP